MYKAVVGSCAGLVRNSEHDDKYELILLVCIKMKYIRATEFRVHYTHV